MWSGGVIDLQIVEIFQGSGAWVDAFNFFFTLVWVFGLISLTLSLIIRVLTRS